MIRKFDAMLWYTVMKTGIRVAIRERLAFDALSELVVVGGEDTIVGMIVVDIDSVHMCIALGSFRVVYCFLGAYRLLQMNVAEPRRLVDTNSSCRVPLRGWLPSKLA